jgi:glycosyltransferase involved in cell wall biosynthesis
VEQFAQGDGAAFRIQNNIPADSFVVGHLGRLAAEKNLEFLARAVAEFIRSHRQARFLVIGTGPAEAAIRAIFSQAGLEARLLICGILPPRELADALSAMNLFAFASQSETQGMVLTEAMAAGLPVVALDATGVREVVRDQQNGRLLQEQTIEAFSDALAWAHDLPADQMEQQIAAARETAEAFSMSRSADQALECFASLQQATAKHSREAERGWEQVMARIKAEWEIIGSVTRAGDGALSNPRATDDGNR